MASRTQSREAARERAAATLRAQRRRERIRWGLVIGVPAAVIVVAAVVIIPLVVSPHTADTPSPSTASQLLPATPDAGAPVTQAAATPVTTSTGVAGVLAWDTTGWPGDGAAHAGALEHDHVTGPVSYSVTPPVGGPHDGVWMNAGVYTQPIPSERAVHNMEHGAVWITYRPGLSAADVTKLESFVGRQTLIAEQTNVPGQQNRYVDMSPWADDSLPAPIVISSWGYQLRLDTVDSARLQSFVDTFRFSKTYSPEYDEPVDGIPVQTGGRAAMYGATVANPAGTAAG